MLDSAPPSFRNSLASLDRMPTRFCDTVFVLFLREGVSQPQDILSQQVRPSHPLRGRVTHHVPTPSSTA